jgi:hypothetical protein
MNYRYLKLIAGAGLALAPLSAAFAAPERPEEVRAAASPDTSSAEHPFGAASTVSDAALDQATAREDLSLVAETEQASEVSGNSVTGRSNTGDIRIADQAFESASGMTIVNANSGNNVTINASVNVNIVVAPPQP